jgi:hypothetical protein
VRPCQPAVGKKKIRIKGNSLIQQVDGLEKIFILR